MSASDTVNPLPDLESDEAAERFVDEADLSAYDLSAMKRVRFEFDKKTARVNMRLPQGLLDRLKAEAEARGIPYQRLIREVLEAHIGGRKPDGA